jgi:cold shock CspA family protein
VLPIGRLIRWNDAKGFGFVRADSVERGEDVFIHRSVLLAANIRAPRLGDALIYEIGERQGKSLVVSCEALHSWREQPEIDGDGWPSHIDLPTSRKAPGATMKRVAKNEITK